MMTKKQKERRKKDWQMTQSLHSESCARHADEGGRRRREKKRKKMMTMKRRKNKRRRRGREEDGQIEERLKAYSPSPVHAPPMVVEEEVT